jgi:hypothetical protein
MKPRLHLTPAQLVLVSLFSFVISAADLSLIRFAHTTDGHACIDWIPFLLIFGGFVLGIVVSLYVISSLKNGIANQQWPEKQIEPLRSVLASWYTNALLVVLLVAYGVLWLVYPKYRATGLACFVLMQVLAQLRTAVRRPSAKPSNLIAGWRDLSPIHSDHWGHR